MKAEVIGSILWQEKDNGQKTLVVNAEIENTKVETPLDINKKEEHANGNVKNEEAPVKKTLLYYIGYFVGKNPGFLFYILIIVILLIVKFNCYSTIKDSEDIMYISDSTKRMLLDVPIDSNSNNEIKPRVNNKQGGIVEAPKSDDEDKIFQKVEIDAEFQGGTQSWFKYVTREIERNIDLIQNDGKSGTVVVLFIVDKEGAVSEVRAMPCSVAGVANCLGAGSKLAEVAVNAIRNGPKWKPAMHNGRTVKAYRRQPVTFKLEEE
jgi:hypothetical protein